MYYIYILESEKDGRKYVGMTTSIERRLKEHNRGNVFATKGRKPLKLLYSEKMNCRIEARKREKYFKSGIGREVIIAMFEINKGNMRL